MAYTVPIHQCTAEHPTHRGPPHRGTPYSPLTCPTADSTRRRSATPRNTLLTADLPYRGLYSHRGTPY